MKKVNILIITILLAFFTNVAYSETKKDCSQYSNKTIVGQYDKWRCEKGKPERKKFKLKDQKFPFKI